MCMLIHHTPKSHLTRDMLRNFVEHNGDGFGFMTFDAKRKKVNIVKLPFADSKQVIALYDEYIRGREAVMHFRMRTHGEVNRDNTHPYKVQDGLWMAHNGVLSTGNARRPEMSDTWHLIEDYLRPVLESAPALIHTPQFQRMLGAFIGSNNKLGFMDSKGRVAIVNRTSGIEHANTWFSNTYAWNPEKFGVVTANKYYTPKSPVLAAQKATATPATAAAPPSKKERRAARKAGGSTKAGRVLTDWDKEVLTIRGEQIDRSWLRRSFPDRYGNGVLSDERTLDVAERLLRDDMRVRD